VLLLSQGKGKLRDLRKNVLGHGERAAFLFGKEGACFCDDWWRRRSRVKKEPCAAAAERVVARLPKKRKRPNWSDGQARDESAGEKAGTSSEDCSLSITQEIFFKADSEGVDLIIEKSLLLQKGPLRKGESALKREGARISKRGAPSCSK